ncbi:caspase family protein [Shimia sp. R11_0]|uniref:caspase family protein n=1 Tax=Shimia sp. R11_0 TaxID=2821096 RepID=UPI001ADCD4B6|nr:caspase family protein [Shimia sp. R11_0]MBO9479768.1 caspase family protein [Shimia sp. R11_0]
MVFAAVGAGQADLRGQSHVALVIGSDAYPGEAALRHARQDAAQVAARLRALNYTVVFLENPKRRDILRALAVIQATATEAEQVVIYLAGHGGMWAGESYYVPVDAVAEGGRALRGAMALPVQTFAKVLSDRPRQKIIFFDACRSPKSWAQDAPPAPHLGHTWLAGLALVYAAAPGTMAYDGAKGQSPFASAFLRHVTPISPDLPALVRQIRRDVLSQTQGVQVPWMQSALLVQTYVQKLPKS